MNDDGKPMHEPALLGPDITEVDAATFHAHIAALRAAAKRKALKAPVYKGKTITTATKSRVGVYQVSNGLLATKFEHDKTRVVLPPTFNAVQIAIGADANKLREFLTKKKFLLANSASE